MRIAICIPTFNRPILLEECIIAVKEQKVKNFTSTVFVIDNDPKPRNEEICKKHNVNYIAEKNQGLANVRNKALKITKNYDALVFIDDDDRPKNLKWLINLVEKHQECPNKIILGINEARFEDKVPDWYIELFRTTKISEPKLRKKYGFYYPKYGFGNVLITKNILQSNIKFDKKFNFIGSEDTDFIFSCEKEGIDFCYSINAITLVNHDTKRANPFGFLKRGYKFGLSQSKLVKKHHNIPRYISYYLFNFLAIFIELIKCFFKIFTFKKSKIYWSLHKLSKRVGFVSALFT